MLTTELKSHFLRMYRMAFTDDNFNVTELQLLYHLAEEKGIPKEQLESLFLNPVDHDTAIPTDLETRIEYLYDLTRIIWADGKITEDELSTLKKYCIKFDFLTENVDDLAEYLVECVKNGMQQKDIINQLNSSL